MLQRLNPEHASICMTSPFGRYFPIFYPLFHAFDSCTFPVHSWISVHSLLFLFFDFLYFPLISHISTSQILSGSLCPAEKDWNDRNHPKWTLLRFPRFWGRLFQNCPSCGPNRPLRRYTNSCRCQKRVVFRDPLPPDFSGVYSHSCNKWLSGISRNGGGPPRILIYGPIWVASAWDTSSKERSDRSKMPEGLLLAGPR